MPARGVVADVTRNEPIGRKRRDVCRETDNHAFWNECARIVGAAWRDRPAAARKRPRST